MDALLLIDTDDISFTSEEAAETLSGIVGRARAVGGVLIFASTSDEVADREDDELSVFVPDEEDLVLRSESPDIFEGVEDLAAGLHDLAVDRIVFAGADDGPGSVWASAMAALVCNFDVIVLSDAVVDGEGNAVDWMPAAEEAGAMVKKTADTWLRM
ncbi:hypothetical protein [Brevibacterium sp.]|uniref:hypothetical protein n=1 Tax=Brevibacterium sp. TaxID=1701 RepID=UPI002810ADDB|nr:hypothetical protein [Brevibacterium sp.]